MEPLPVTSGAEKENREPESVIGKLNFYFKLLLQEGTTFVQAKFVFF